MRQTICALAGVMLLAAGISAQAPAAQGSAAGGPREHASRFAGVGGAPLERRQPLIVGGQDPREVQGHRAVRVRQGGDDRFPFTAAELEGLLAAGNVLVHPFVIGEIGQGRRRALVPRGVFPVRVDEDVRVNGNHAPRSA